MQLKKIVPWGRNLNEYKAMFNLTDDDLKLNILGCGDGPSSFNAEVHALGGSVVSVDPIYQFSKDALSRRIDEVKDEVMAQVRAHAEDFVWKNIEDPDALESVRMDAMAEFLEDFERGKSAGRYVCEMLPSLSFGSKEFDLALSSHFLFLYSGHLDFAFHLSSIEEMLRVAKEVRIFPLVTLENRHSPHLESVMKALEKRGYEVKIIKTGYEFQKGADEMLVVR